MQQERRGSGVGATIPLVCSWERGPPLRARGGKAQPQNLETGVSHSLACVWGWGSKAPLRVLVFASGAQEKVQWNAQALWGRLALLGWLKKSGSSGACSGTRERRLRPSCWPKSCPEPCIQLPGQCLPGGRLKWVSHFLFQWVKLISAGRRSILRRPLLHLFGLGCLVYVNMGLLVGLAASLRSS